MPINPSLTDDEEEHKVLRPYRGKESDAIDQNIKLERGEIFIEYSDDGIGTGIGRMKMGDGSTLYRNLPYLFDQTDLSASFLKKFTPTTVTADNTLLGMIANNKNLATITAAEKKLIENRISKEGTLDSTISAIVTKLDNNASSVSKLWSTVVTTTGTNDPGNGSNNGSTTGGKTANASLRSDINTLWLDVFNNTNGGVGNKELRKDISANTTKLGTIQEGAEVNQNAFSKIKVGNVTIEADSKTDTFELEQGENITLTPTASSDKINIKAKDTTYTLSAGTGTDNRKVILTPSSGTAQKITVPFASTAAYAESGGSSSEAQHAVTADTATYATNSGTAVHASTSNYATKSGTATYATKAGSDESGNNIKATYANSLTVDGYTLTLKNKNGAALSTITTTESKTVTAASNSSTVTAAASDGNVYLNHVENNTVKSSHNIKGDFIAVTSGTDGAITLHNIGVREINKSGREGYIQVKAGFAPAADIEVKGVPGMYSDINNASTGIKTQLSDVRDYVYNNSTYSNSHLYDMINHVQYHTNQDWYYIGDTYTESNKTNPNGASLHLGNESWTHDVPNPKHIMIADGLPWKGTYIIFYKFKISNITYNLKRTTGSIAINTTYGATDTECCFSWADLGPNPVKSLSSTEGIIFLKVNDPVSKKYKILLDIVSYIFDKDYENDSATMRQYSYYLKYKLNIIGIGDHKWPE